jgi:PAS domain S-box-containing protein
MTASADTRYEADPTAPTESPAHGDSCALDPAYLAAVLDCAPDPVIASDLDGIIRFANAAASELLGKPADALIGTPVLSCIPCTQIIVDAIDALRHQDLTDHDLEIPSPDGTRWTSVSSRRLRLPNGDVAGTVVYLRDVSERRLAERALEAKNEELEHYVSHVSHDLRSPLVSVLGFSRMLRQQFEVVLDSEGHRFIDRIEQAGKTMTSLVDHLLQVSQIGGAEETDTVIDPLGVIAQVLTDHKQRIDDLGVHIEAPSHPPMLRCSRTRAYQIFSNLIGNALVHMRDQDGSPEAPRIRISIDQDAGYQRICVADNGRGVDPDQRERIFELFTRHGPRPEGHASTGIGLAIVRKIAISHGGRAWVESSPEGGASFHITLRDG